MLNSDLYSAEVKDDIETARQLGINGVPFFVFDNKYAISGAQHAAVFSDGLKQAWAECEKSNTLVTSDGDICSPGGTCEIKN